MNPRTLVITSALAVAGVSLWSYGASKLVASGDFDFRPNPLGIKESPYGQVVALAVQGGIDSDWHGVESAGGEHFCPDCGHNHGDGEGDEACSAKHIDDPNSFIGRLETAVTERTNSRSATPGHKFYLRRQVEDRLKFAYLLDPANYANYNAYHLFLTEPSVGTRPVLTDKVIELARMTVTYCLKEDSDPRPALTAASASANILELMFLHKDEFTIEQMRGQLEMLDYTLSKNRVLTSRWKESGDLERISKARLTEMEGRLTFLSKVQEASVKTIERLSGTSSQISSKF
ncbi:hypothetical protein [Haloferula sp. BvORR071]|uniref:hypothetical protein n=1 Tax=Haloferula sp. BvORR071 TaxID=1396141 RepID=UPI000552364D|nr:hypothetical protein [Haloferula sp. BvORR071]